MSQQNTSSNDNNNDESRTSFELANHQNGATTSFTGRIEKGESRISNSFEIQQILTSNGQAPTQNYAQ